MRAVVECVTEGTPPPVELRLAWQCEKWNTLPEDGGLYDQDFMTMFLMNSLKSMHDAIVRIKAAKGKQIHSLSENDRKILRMLMDEKLLFHA